MYVLSEEKSEAIVEKERQYAAVKRIMNELSMLQRNEGACREKKRAKTRSKFEVKSGLPLRHHCEEPASYV